MKSSSPLVSNVKSLPVSPTAASCASALVTKAVRRAVVLDARDDTGHWLAHRLADPPPTSERGRGGRGMSYAEAEPHMRRYWAEVVAALPKPGEPYYTEEKALQQLRAACEEVVASESRRFNINTAKSILHRPPMPYLIEGLIPKRGIGQFFGPAYRGKSYIKIAMKLALANGLDSCLGLNIATTGPVLDVYEEGAGDLHERLAAWLSLNPRCTLDNYLIMEEQALDLPARRTSRRSSRRSSAWCGDSPPVLTTFDTQAAHMPGTDEREKDFGVAIANLRAIAQATGGAVQTVHHTGWDESRVRGSSMQRAAWDFQYSFNGRLLVPTKLRAFDHHMLDVPIAPKSVLLTASSSQPAGERGRRVRHGRRAATPSITARSHRRDPGHRRPPFCRAQVT